MGSIALQVVEIFRKLAYLSRKRTRSERPRDENATVVKDTPTVSCTDLAAIPEANSLGIPSLRSIDLLKLKNSIQSKSGIKPISSLFDVSTASEFRISWPYRYGHGMVPERGSCSLWTGLSKTTKKELRRREVWLRS